jgi:hypothetical protein
MQKNQYTKKETGKEACSPANWALCTKKPFLSVQIGERIDPLSAQKAKWNT